MPEYSNIQEGQNHTTNYWTAWLTKCLTISCSKLYILHFTTAHFGDISRLCSCLETSVRFFSLRGYEDDSFFVLLFIVFITYCV